MKKNYLFSLSLIPIGFVAPITLINACSNANQNNQPTFSTVYEIDFAPVKPLDFGDSKSTFAASEADLKAFIIQNKEQVFNFKNNQQPANFDWNANLNVANKIIVANQKLQIDVVLSKWNSNNLNAQPIKATLKFNNFAALSDLEMAIINIQTLLKTISVNVKPSEWRTPGQFPDPKNNLGFNLLAEPGQENDKIKPLITIADGSNDEKGEKYLKFTFSRGNQKAVVKEIITDLTSNEQERVEQNLDSNQYLNDVDFANMSSLTNKKPQTKIEDALTAEKVQELVNIAPVPTDKPDLFDSLLKKPLPSDYQLRIFDIRPLIINGIAIGIVGKTKMIHNSDSALNSKAHSFIVTGFDETNRLAETTLQNIFPTFNTFFNYIFSSDYQNQKASGINTLEQLKNFVNFDEEIVNDIFFPAVKLELIDLVANSGNDQEGSLKIKLKASWVQQPSTSFTDEIKLFGFKIIP